MSKELKVLKTKFAYEQYLHGYYLQLQMYFAK